MTGISIEGAGGYWPRHRVPALAPGQLVHTVYLPAKVRAPRSATAAAVNATAVVSAVGAVVSLDPAPPTRPRGIPVPTMATAPRPVEVVTRTPWDDLLSGRTHALDRHVVTVTVAPDPAADLDVDAVLVDLVTWMTLPTWQQLVVRTPDGPLYVRLPNRSSSDRAPGGAR